MADKSARELPAFAVDFPSRLLAYLEDMLATGLYGNDLDDVVIGCVQREIQRAVVDGFIRQRVRGRVQRSR